MYFDSDEWKSSFEAKHISPQSLMKKAKDRAKQVYLSGSDRSKVCLLRPGRCYGLSRALEPLPTPQAIMSGEHTPKEGLDYVTIVPRLPQHSSVKDIEFIIFNCRGRPGVYLTELESGVRIDNAKDPVFQNKEWKRTRVQVDWPGTERIGTHSNLSCLPGQGFHTRQDVAVEVGKQVREMLLSHNIYKNTYTRQELDKIMRRWDIRSINYSAVRILGLIYYNNWVPVLAIDEPESR